MKNLQVRSNRKYPFLLAFIVTQIATSVLKAQGPVFYSGQLTDLYSGNPHSHPFTGLPQAPAGTQVGVEIFVRANLGCNAADSCSCSPCSESCCDVDPDLKYVTVTNLSGTFFGPWNNENPTTPAYGRSPCAGGNSTPNNAIQYINASTWNTIIGASGNETITITASSSATRLQSYCNSIGAPGAVASYSQIVLHYPCMPAYCPQGNQCQEAACSGQTCVLNNKSNGTSCSDGVFCNGSDTCLSGACTGHAGDPCTNGEYCDESVDACQRVIVSSSPPDGAIDARRPHHPNNTSTTYGWSSVLLTMSGSASGITSGNFSVSSSNGTAPTVSNATPSGNDVTLTLSGRIPPDAWTEITYDPGQSSICLGYLPADANESEVSNGADITDLVDHLNSVYSPPMAIWQCDIDRSAVCAPADIIDMVDLLNGANDYDEWNGLGIEDSPCEGESLLGGGGEPEDHFAESFLTYLSETILADSQAEAEFEAVINTLTQWCSSNCSGDAREQIVAALQGESLTFQNEIAPQLVAQILTTLAE